jgi:hypothetical protein
LVFAPELRQKFFHGGVQAAQSRVGPANSSALIFDYILFKLADHFFHFL